MLKSAVLSYDRKYRYLLTRRWGPGLTATFIMLNPSTADEAIDDPTIKRCIGFAARWGCAAISIGNLFAYRTKDPGLLKKVNDPVGPDNMRHLRALVAGAKSGTGYVVVAWGSLGGMMGQDEAFLNVSEHLIELRALRLTKKGMPEHPLYVPYSVEPVIVV